MVGGVGQLGQSLAPALTYMYGLENVLTTDVIEATNLKVKIPTSYQKLNAMDLEAFRGLVDDFAPTTVLHLPAILSGGLTSEGRDGRGDGDPH